MVGQQSLRDGELRRAVMVGEGWLQVQSRTSGRMPGCSSFPGVVDAVIAIPLVHFDHPFRCGLMHTLTGQSILFHDLTSYLAPCSDLRTPYGQYKGHEGQRRADAT